MRETPSIAQHCVSTRLDGAPCTAQAGASDYCIGHDPGAMEARRKGGLLRRCEGNIGSGEDYDGPGEPLHEVLEQGHD